MRSEIIPIVACDNYITVFNTSTTKFHPRIRLFHKKFQKKKSVQPTDRPTRSINVTIQFNSLYMCPGKPTHPPTHLRSPPTIWLFGWRFVVTYMGGPSSSFRGQPEDEEYESWFWIKNFGGVGGLSFRTQRLQSVPNPM